MKVYVDTVVKFTVEGKMVPQAVIWENSRQYVIDRIIKVEPSSRWGTDLQYTCRISGKEKHLYFERGKWFVEGKQE